MKVLVVGASGGSGRAALHELLRRDHEVTAFSRHATALAARLGTDRVRGIDGDATNPSDVDRAVRGQDAVVVTLGISENPVMVRLRGPASTPADVRSRGTHIIIEAMRRYGVRRLVVQTSYGVGPTRAHLPVMQRLIFWLLLLPQIADTERQDQLVRSSGLDWINIQPVNLTDDAAAGLPFASTTGEIRGTKVARARVGRVLAEAVEGRDYVGQTVSLSASDARRAPVSTA